METKQCIIEGCTNTAIATRRYCREHYLQRQRDNYYKRMESGTYHYTTYPCVCLWCGKPFMGYRKDTMTCSKECAKAVRVAITSLSSYKLSKSSGKWAWQHKFLAKQAIGEEALIGKHLHHKDFNPSNNALSNLLVLPGSVHAKLHAFIRINVIKRTAYNDPDRRKHMYEMIPELTNEFFAKSGIVAESVEDIVNRLSGGIGDTRHA